MKKLGIVIPTYNRSSFLLEALEALLPQVLQFKDVVMVVVCDNASNDGTKEAISPYLVKYREVLQYFRHDSNQGYFYNFKFGIYHLDTEYVFLHGDDDLMPPYFVGYILSLLEQNKRVGLIHFNYFYSLPDMRNLRLKYMGLKERIMTKKYLDGISFIKEHYEIPSYMSSNVFLRDAWIKGESEKTEKECYGYEWLYAMYRGCLNYPCLFVNMPLFIQRFSRLEDYTSKWPLYSLVGIYRVFQYLDDGENDIFRTWVFHHQKKAQKQFYHSIGITCFDKQFYRKNFSEISTYIYGINKVLIFLCVYVFPSNITKYIYMKGVSFLAKIKILT